MPAMSASQAWPLFHPRKVRFGPNPEMLIASRLSALYPKNRKFATVSKTSESARRRYPNI